MPNAHHRLMVAGRPEDEPVPAHEIVAGLLACMVADGRALEAHQPDQWHFCPYCGLPIDNLRLP